MYCQIVLAELNRKVKLTWQNALSIKSVYKANCAWHSYVKDVFHIALHGYVLNITVFWNMDFGRYNTHGPP